MVAVAVCFDQVAGQSNREEREGGRGSRNKKFRSVHLACSFTSEWSGAVRVSLHLHQAGGGVLPMSKRIIIA
jgi:hypothetical protein